MKDIGFTQEGNRLVEMSNEEYAAFGRLYKAVEGKFPDCYNPTIPTFQTSYDFTKTFEVIKAFYDAHFRINELQSLLDAFEDGLNRV